MTRYVRNARAPIFFFRAENDWDLSPSRTLAAVAESAGKDYQVKIYPPFGESREDGHAFGYFGSAVLVTDGLTEAANENEDEYGLERVKQQVMKHSGESLKVHCEMLLGEARKFGKQMDDQCAIGEASLSTLICLSVNMIRFRR
jgi:stage II sporulation SpoE-like protein